VSNPAGEETELHAMHPSWLLVNAVSRAVLCKGARVQGCKGGTFVRESMSCIVAAVCT
jgi:hypothetical protein